MEEKEIVENKKRLEDALDSYVEGKEEVKSYYVFMKEIDEWMKEENEK